MKKYLFLALALSASASAQAVWKFSSGTVYTLKACVRQPSQGVQCTFTVTNPNEDRTPYFNANDLRLISPTGKEVTLASLEFNGNPVKFYDNLNVRKGIDYTIKFNFLDYPESQIKYFDFSGERRENIAVLGEVNTKNATSNPTSNAHEVSTLPGQADWRQRIKLGNTNYLAVVHDCYSKGATANCLITLLPDNVTGNAIDNIVLYSGTLVEISGQKISNNTVNIQLGDSLIRGVPLH